MNRAGRQYYDSFGVDSVSLQNLSIGIDLPVRSKRGAIPFLYTLSGNSSCDIIPSGVNGSIKNVECGIGQNKYLASANNFQNWAPQEVTNMGHWVFHYTVRTSGVCAADNNRATTTYNGWYITSPLFETYYLPYSAKTVVETSGGSCTVNISNMVTLNGGLTVSI